MSRIIEVNEYVGKVQIIDGKLMQMISVCETNGAFVGVRYEEIKEATPEEMAQIDGSK